VFVIPGAPKRYLRFVPVGSDAATLLRRGTALASAFPETPGLRVARPIDTPAGESTPTVSTDLGPMVAALVEEAPGEEIDPADLTTELAHRWGAALAGFHAAAPSVDARHPLADPSPATPADRELADAARHLDARLDALGAGSHRMVTMHGDFELDNLRFTDDAVAVFDLDGCGTGPAAADIALAARALVGDEGDEPRPEHAAAFVAGYRSVATLTDAEIAAIELYALRNSVRRARETSFLDEGDEPSAPEWQRELHEALVEANAWHRSMVLAASASERETSSSRAIDPV
jgi:Ser/Thr protein kinase RdoA (MazF antagonist)